MTAGKMHISPKHYDVIVVGAGHAGIEAALAAARMGCETLLLTFNLDSIGQMSCNPAIGGSAKGHLVREIDALGGEMGKAADMCGIQFRMLNKSKGPSVWSPRAQCDKKAYQFYMKWICEQQDHLDVKQGQVARVLTKNGVATGVETECYVRYSGSAVVITTGTFLRGLMHVGRVKSQGGRSGDSASNGLSDSLRRIGLSLGRFKTGTPPRLNRKTVSISKTRPQFGDYPIPSFSFWKSGPFHVEHLDGSSGAGACSIVSRIDGQVPCYLTNTTKATDRIIRANIHLSPMYSGVIEGVGPRYCPSIEDKIVRFTGKESHQVYLEPEGISTDELYVNGVSTCLPINVQWELVRTIVGCERAEIMRPAYAVEYDFSFPTQLDCTLESKACRNLFLAGQINGTSGYEEAASQGIVAGINAAMRIRGKVGITFDRRLSYIGVLIDDLVTKGTTEPYRMFTSRAEHRMLLRQDNAHLRLAHVGYSSGLLSLRQFQMVQNLESAIQNEISRLCTVRYGSQPLIQILRRPEVGYADLPSRDDRIAGEVIRHVEAEVKYSGYIRRQESEVQRLSALEDHRIPDWIDYESMPSLRNEARQKFSSIRPRTLGQAARISGISPADISLLAIWIKRGTSNQFLSDPSPS